MKPPFLLLLLFFSSALLGSERATLGVILFPPNVLIDEVTGECRGHGIQTTREILAEYSIEIDVICAPPVRIYRLLENAEIDFTINIKSTKGLPEDVTFIDKPYRILQLKLYSHLDRKNGKDVAAVRGFDYQGFRNKLIQQEYRFFDLPNSISSIQVFLKKRIPHLISYGGPYGYYIRDKKLKVSDAITSTHLYSVPTHYTITNKSPHLKALIAAFDLYADTYQVEYFKQKKLVNK